MQRRFIKPTLGGKVFDICNHVFMVLLCVAMIYPIFYLAMLSLTASDVPLTKGYLIPPHVSLENYAQVMSNHYIGYGFVNAIRRTLVGTVFSVAMMLLTAYPLSKKYFPSRRFWTGFVVFTMFFSGGIYIHEKHLNTGNGYEDRIVEHYKELGIENIADYVNDDDTIDSSTVDKVMRMEIQKWKDIVVESLQNNGLELEENQINALTAIAYEYGWSNEDAVSFKSAYNNYYLNGNVEGFRTQFYIADHTVRPFYVSDIEPSSELARKTQIKAELNWNLFDTGQYRTPDGEILDPDSFKGIISGEFLEVAQAVWQMVCDVDPEYSMAYGKMVPPAENFSVVDCSHYVSWVLYEYGVATNNDELVKTFEGGQHSTETLMTVNWDALGFELISVSSMPGGLAANVQPGDILIKDGHTDIAVEYVDGTLWTYDCGNVYNWRGSNGEPVAKNYMLNQTHTVIRLKK